MGIELPSLSLSEGIGVWILAMAETGRIVLSGGDRARGLHKESKYFRRNEFRQSGFHKRFMGLGKVTPSVLDDARARYR